MLDLITTARGQYGPANSLYANLPINSLIDWHAAREDAALSKTPALYYRAGLLYGVDLTEKLSEQVDMGGKFIVEDVTVMDAITEQLYASYEDIDEHTETWRYQKARELKYTGGSTLTILNAGLNFLLGESLRTAPTTELKDDAESADRHFSDEVSLAAASHVGLVDGVILGSAFRARRLGIPVEQFNTPSESYIEDYDSERHTAYPYAYPFRSAGVERVHLRSVNDLLTLAEGMKDMDDISKTAIIGIKHEVRGRLAQDGPNSFVVVAEEAKVTAKPSLALLAGALATGLMYDALQHFTGQETAQVSFFLPDATLVSMIGCGLLEAGKATLARDMARIHSVEFEYRGLIHSIKGGLHSLRSNRAG